VIRTETGLRGQSNKANDAKTTTVSNCKFVKLDRNSWSTLAKFSREIMARIKART